MTEEHSFHYVVDNVTIVTDDRAARKQANKRGIPRSGTLGGLKKLVDDGKVLESQADTYLANMIAEGYQSPVTRLSQIRR